MKNQKNLDRPGFCHLQATVLNIFGTVIPCLTLLNGNRVEQITFFTALLHSPAGSGSRNILAEPVLCFTSVEKISAHLSLFSGSEIQKRSICQIPKFIMSLENEDSLNMKIIPFAINDEDYYLGAISWWARENEFFSLVVR